MTDRTRYTAKRLDSHERPKEIFTFYATGRGTFPFDMLRYDGAWPADSAAASRMDWNPMIHGKPSESLRCVKLHSYRIPTPERWQSFVWSIGTEDLTPKA
jgi:hypothetical protein